MKLKRLFQVSSLPCCGSIAMLALRLVAGTAFAIHGWGKIQNPFGWMGPDSSIPGIFLGLAALSEFGGGIAWVLGLLTPLASFGIACTMTVAAATHLSKGDPFVGQGASYELALVYLCVALALLACGPGCCSVDRKVFGSREGGDCPAGPGK